MQDFFFPLSRNDDMTHDEEFDFQNNISDLGSGGLKCYSTNFLHEFCHRLKLPTQVQRF